MRERVSNRTRIFIRIFDEFLLVDRVEIDLIEAGRDSRLQAKINPIQQSLLRFSNAVFRITRMFLDKTPEEPL